MPLVLLLSVVGCSGKGNGWAPAAKPDFVMSSTDLGGELDRNPKGTDAKYRGKRLELNGRVIRVETFGDKKPPEERGLFVTISHEVNCRFPESERAEVAKLRQGDIVTIVGVYHVIESKNYPILDDCRLRPAAK